MSSHFRHASEAKNEIGIDNEKLRVFIAGAGVGGCFTALELAQIKTPAGSAKYEIILADKKDEILRGSSDITPARMGLGFHYVHKPTAIMYLKATVQFQKKYSKVKNFTVGADLPEGDPVRRVLQRGRYFITKDSKPGSKEILETYEVLKQEYTQLVEEDAENEVFGKPEDFFRVLMPEEYSHYVEIENVDIGIETAECLLHWSSFRKYLISQLREHENIKIKVGTTVARISQELEEFKYLVETSEDVGIRKKQEIHRVDAVVNCTWENVRALNATAGIREPEEVRTNRLKALIIFYLPELLKNAPSAFFCMGPYCMFSNLGLDTSGQFIGAATYAPKTSMIQSTEVCVPESINKYLHGHVALDEKLTIGESIKEGVAKFIPEMGKAKIKEVRFGIVQTKGKVDIFNPTSEFSLRDYNGINVEQLNFVSNACMKLLYGPENGEIVAGIVEDHMKELSAVRQYIASLDKKHKSVAEADTGKENNSDLFRFSTLKVMLKKELTFFGTEKHRRNQDEFGAHKAHLKGVAL